MLWLLIAHFIADWGLQSEFVATNKGKYYMVMVAHCTIWAGCVSIVLQHLGIFSYEKFAFLFIGHWIMDKIKCNSLKMCCADNEKHNLNWLHFDQLFYVVQCVLVYVI